MDNNMVNNPVFKTMKITPRLRFVERDMPCIDPGFYGNARPKYRILQQASVCLEDGSIEWNDVPMETE